MKGRQQTAAMYCDLHFHTYYSNGANANPREVMPLMARSNCKGFASADHDALEAIPIFQQGAQEHGLEYIPGVEVSTRDPDVGDLHILGYGFDPEDSALRELLSKRIAFNHEMYCRALDELISIGRIPDEASFEAYWKKDDPEKRMTLTHVDWWLLEQGMVPDLEAARRMYRDAIREYALLDPKPLPEEAIVTLHKAGGLAVLAHPAYGSDIGTAQNRIDHVRPLGIEGIEVYTPNNGADDQIEAIRRIATSHGLLITGGSDCHAKCSQLATWPSQAPYACFQALKSALGSPLQ